MPSFGASSRCCSGDEICEHLVTEIEARSRRRAAEDAEYERARRNPPRGNASPPRPTPSHHRGSWSRSTPEEDFGAPTPVDLLPDPPKPRARRGTSNGNDRESNLDRRRRRAWMMTTYASDVPGFVRCYRCGCLLYNPDDRPDAPGALALTSFSEYGTARIRALPLTVDRTIPGCKGGTYRRNNIRPACGPCNSETGGGLAATKTRKP